VNFGVCSPVFKKNLSLISPSIIELIFINVTNSTQNKITMATLEERTFNNQEEVLSSQQESKKMEQKTNKKFYEQERYARKRACDPLWTKQRQEKEKLRKRAKRAAKQMAKTALNGPSEAEHGSTPCQELQTVVTDLNETEASGSGRPSSPDATRK
jgi:ribosomal protein L32E